METVQKGGLPAQEKSESVMETGSMTVSEFADFLVKKGAEKPAEAPKEEAAVEPAAEEVVKEEAQAEPEATEPVEAEGEKSEGNEQPEEKPEAEDEEVLSKLDPRTQEKIDKRIGKAVAAKKQAEEKAAALEARLKELEAKASEPKPEPEVVAVPVVEDPHDLTAKAVKEADLDKLENDARMVVGAYEDNEDAILRAVARDEPTVVIGGEEVSVAKLKAMKKQADKHLRELIPARRKFLKERGQAVEVAKKRFPTLFDSRSQEYQELQAVLRQYPQLRSIPTLETMVGYALVGMASERQAMEAAAKAKATPATKTAAETPPKSGADDKGTTAAAKPKAAAQGEKSRLKAELEKAEKELDRTGSKNAYEKVLILQDRLKKLN